MYANVGSTSSQQSTSCLNLFSECQGVRTFLVRNLDPVHLSHITHFYSIAIPVLAICGQRVVIDLRRFMPTRQDSIEISKEVDRQIGALSWNQLYQLSVIRQSDFDPDGENTWPGSGDEVNDMW